MNCTAYTTTTPSAFAFANVSFAAPTNGRGRSFPRKLFTMLEDAETMGFSDVVAWQPNGQSFKVLQPKKFESGIMQHYFNQTKYKSFQRQLNIYGFQRIHYGADKGGYCHASLNRQRPDLIEQIIREFAPEQKSHEAINKRIAAAAAAPATASNNDFAFPAVATAVEAVAEKSIEVFATPISVQGFPTAQFDNYKFDTALEVKPLHGNNDFDIYSPELKLFGEVFGESSNNNNKDEPIFLEGIGQLSRFEEQDIIELNPARPAPAVESYSDDLITFDDDLFSDSILETTSMIEDEEQQASGPTTEHVFPWKVHTMLDDAKENGFENIVSWVEDGAAFKVHDSDRFVKEIMPSYFDQTKYESFRRQLNLYGFARVTRGENKGVYFHEFFLESDRRLCRNIVRTRTSGSL